MKNKCYKCGEEKSSDNFYKNKTKKNGLSDTCKDCQKAYHKKYRMENKEELNRKNKVWIEKNIEEVKRKRKIFTAKNKDKKALYDKEYRSKNGDRIEGRIKEWRKNNAVEIAKRRHAKYKANKPRLQAYQKANKKQRNKRRRERYASDPLYKLSTLIRNNARRILLALKKDCPKTQAIKPPSFEHLGCSLEEFKAHIESQWEEGMSWENHTHDGWHLDHITPLDWFIKNSDDPWEANHYTNFQPLWGRDNMSKHNKLFFKS